MAIFKGFKQVSLSTYNQTSAEDKKEYLWLVREFSGETVLSSAIYFGTRKYAELNNDSAANEKINNIIASLGDAIDANGEWVGFLPFEEHEILGGTGLTSVSDALTVLEAAILANTDAITGKVSQSEYDAKVAEIEGKLEQISGSTLSAVTAEIEALEAEIATKASKDELDAVDDKVDDVSQKADELEDSISALTQILETKADAADVYTKNEVYTKSEVDAKVAGVFHFVGNADAVSSDFTTITVNGEDILASAENEGDVYQIGEVEYASNGSVWVKLGFNIDLSDFATKEYVDSALTAESAARRALEDELTTTNEALAEEIQAREGLSDDVDIIRSESTTSANTFSDAEELSLKLGQIVYVLNDEVVSDVTYPSGAYIYTQSGLRKLDSTTPSTSTTLEERVESLENSVGALSTNVGDTTVFVGASVSEAIADLQDTTTIEGDDVEE